jgi:hypothetical protein
MGDIVRYVPVRNTDLPDELVEALIPKRHPAIIVDLDGTLALMNGRGPFEQHKCDTDLLCRPVAQAVHGLSLMGYLVLITTGRFQQHFGKTKEWLIREKVPHARIYMRADGDYLKDAVVKREIYENQIEPYYDVLLVLDDRAQVVNMWRELGLQCLQVAPGGF